MENFNINFLNRVMTVIESEAINSTLSPEPLYDHLYDMADSMVGELSSPGNEYDNITISSVIDTRSEILNRIDSLAYDIVHTATFKL